MFYSLSSSQSIFVYAFSSIIALCSEVGYVLTQISLHTNVKVFVESTSLTIRSITNCILLCLFPSLGLKGFCIGELVYAFCFPLLFVSYDFRYLQLRFSDLPPATQSRHKFLSSYSFLYRNSSPIFTTNRFYKSVNAVL